MNKYKFIISAFLFTLACHALNAQSHGIIVGTTYGDFKTKIASMSDIKFNKQYSFNFLVGYGYNHSFNNRLELGSSLIYSQQKAVKTSGYGVVGDDPSVNNYNFKTHYLALEEVIKYRITDHIKVGVGAAPTWHMKMTLWDDNEVSPIIDIPLLLQTEVETKYADIRLSYKLGTFNLLKNSIIDLAHHSVISLSLFIPFGVVK